MDMTLSHVKQEKGRERLEQENQLQVPRGPKSQKEPVAKMVGLYREEQPSLGWKVQGWGQGIPVSRVLLQVNNEGYRDKLMPKFALIY